MRDAACRHDRIRMPDEPAPLRLTVSELAAWLCAAAVAGFGLAIHLVIP